VCYYCTSPIMQINGDERKRETCYYSASPITQVSETRVARGVSPFIMKMGASPIPYI
jgi:hypothetical protein